MRALPGRRDRAHSSPERNSRLGGRLRRSLILVALCLVAASCGGAENEPNLAQAAERTEAQGTGRFEVSGVQRTNDDSVPVSCTGEADYEAKSVRVDCEYASADEIDVIAVGNDFYVRGMAFTGTNEKWVKFEGGVDDDTSLATLSPQKLLRLLRSASSETERVGEEDVRGEGTVRYRLVVDCEAAKLECSSSTSVEVWVADDGVVRRISLEDDDGTATFEFFDFGAHVRIEAPPASDVAEGDLVAGDSSSGGGTSAGIEVTCADGEAVPISQRRAVTTLRRHGFQMQDSEFCIVDNGGSAGEIPDEGLVSCGVDAKPRAGAPVTVTRGTDELEDVTFELRNLKCGIVTGPDGREGKIARLEQAFAELEQAIRP